MTSVGDFKVHLGYDFVPNSGEGFKMVSSLDRTHAVGSACKNEVSLVQPHKLTDVTDQLIQLIVHVFGEILLSDLAVDLYHSCFTNN